MHYKYMPLAHKIMVRLDRVTKTTESVDDNTVRTKSGLYLPKKNEITDHEDRVGEAVEVGVLVATGSYAFKDIDGCPDGEWAQIGDRVVFPAYSGRKWKDEDGTYYRIFEDQLLYAVEPQVEEKTHHVK